MDDMKLIAKDATQLNQVLTIVKGFSDDIKMKFGLDKCATAIFKRGKLIKSQNIQMSDLTDIINIDTNVTHKYLGIEESYGIDNIQMNEKIGKEYLREIRQIVKTELSADNMITAINNLAVPVA